MEFGNTDKSCSVALPPPPVATPLSPALDLRTISAPMGLIGKVVQIETWNGSVRAWDLVRVDRILDFPHQTLLQVTQLENICNGYLYQDDLSPRLREGGSELRSISDGLKAGYDCSLVSSEEERRHWEEIKPYFAAKRESDAKIRAEIDAQRRKEELKHEVLDWASKLVVAAMVVYAASHLWEKTAKFLQKARAGEVIKARSSEGIPLPPALRPKSTNSQGPLPHTIKPNGSNDRTPEK